ncbi:hypothetical protein TUM4630_29710 [Shewanella algidipiscicola]|uniref:Transposase n=1 Tax=Shewanella algidipiscicola TaxID=614070 RepID=A0ABQ4PNB4_9GAMM|nr:hypothetical protein TUM4630_29710 [Shewanella algidipiscicola]
MVVQAKLNIALNTLLNTQSILDIAEAMNGFSPPVNGQQYKLRNRKIPE